MRTNDLFLAIYLSRPSDHLALPNFDVVNTTWESTTNLWHGVAPLEYPRQLMIDFSQRKNGVILGIACKYPNGEGTFSRFEQRLQGLLDLEPKLKTAGEFILWRDEQRKRAVTLTLDESRKNLQLIVVSLDKEVRGSRILPEDWPQPLD